jgi:hypothetical protein
MEKKKGKERDLLAVEAKRKKIVSNVKDGEREGKRMRGKIERRSWQ